MADLRIDNIKINPHQDWGDIAKFTNWRNVQSSSLHWNNLNQISRVNQPIVIQVEVIISSWERIKESFTDWELVKEENLTWVALKIW
ncbi:MAG: hypothetical protein K0R00_3357 [Herbinix sp.]|jgi:hypothetical protein|nr:hypothetical protein [Herbinix sp.]